MAPAAAPMIFADRRSICVRTEPAGRSARHCRAGRGEGGGPGPAIAPRNPPALGPCCPSGGPLRPRPGASLGYASVRERRPGRSFGLPTPAVPAPPSGDEAMHTSLAAQLAQLELGHLAIDRSDQPGTTDLPESEAIEQTLAAVWSDLLALFPDTALEEDAEEIAWGLVNIFHRAAAKRGIQLDRVTDEIRLLLASADGSEVHSTELEQQIARAQAAEAAMIGLEAFREASPRLYINETGSSWRPATGSRLNHSPALTSAVVDGRDFLRARAQSRKRAAMPEGTLVLFAGGRLSFATADDAKAVADSVWAALDKVREHVADMVLVHGGDT